MLIQKSYPAYEKLKCGDPPCRLVRKCLRSVASALSPYTGLPKLIRACRNLDELSEPALSVYTGLANLPRLRTTLRNFAETKLAELCGD